MFLKIIVLKQAIKKQQLCIVALIVKDTKFLDFQFCIPPTYNTAKYVFFVFVAIAIAVFCVQLVKQIFLYIYKEVSGAFSGAAYFFNNVICTWFCFSKKITSRHLFHYLLIKMFQSLRTNSQGLNENFVNLIFNEILYVSLCKSLCISNVPAVFFVKRVLTNFAKFTENT